MKYLLLSLLTLFTPLIADLEDKRLEKKISIAKNVNKKILKNRYLKLENAVNSIASNPIFNVLRQNFEENKNEENYNLLADFLREQSLIQKKQLKNLIILFTDDTNFPVWRSSIKNSFQKYSRGGITFSDVLQPNVLLRAEKYGKSSGFSSNKVGKIKSICIAIKVGSAIMVQTGREDAIIDTSTATATD